MAKDLAREIGYTYIDTGAMYRAVTLYALQQGFFTGQVLNETALKQAIPTLNIALRLNPDNGQQETLLNGLNVEHEIRGMEVAGRVSAVAALPFVRQAMVPLQQQMGQERGIVMDGRDIGTVVFPQAELKVFVTASARIRAQRRLDELQAKGDSRTTLADVLANVEERDRIDSTRTEGPLRQAADALLLDNSHLTIPEQKEWLLARYREATNR